MTDDSPTLTARIRVDGEQTRAIIDEAIEYIKNSDSSPLDYPHLDAEDVIRATAERVVEETVTMEIEDDAQ